jgi:hypothetical protein
LDIGADVRHISDYRGAYFGVFDKSHVTIAINVGIQHLRFDELLSLLYTDDPVFADYLVAIFEMFWNQAVPAEERIKEVLELLPPKHKLGHAHENG